MFQSRQKFVRSTLKTDFSYFIKRSFLNMFFFRSIPVISDASSQSILVPNARNFSSPRNEPELDPNGNEPDHSSQRRSEQERDGKFTSSLDARSDINNDNDYNSCDGCDSSCNYNDSYG